MEQRHSSKMRDKMFDLTEYSQEYIEREPIDVGEIRHTRHFEHPTRTHQGRYAYRAWPETHFVHVNLKCPLCDTPTESYTDCPGYGNPVTVCYLPYNEYTITKKFVQALACGNSELYVCINPECEWEWRTHNRRGNQGIDPEWKDHAESYDPFGDEDDDNS